jgi:hypothetical protein
MQFILHFFVYAFFYQPPVYRESSYKTKHHSKLLTNQNKIVLASSLCLKIKNVAIAIPSYIPICHDVSESASALTLQSILV